MDSNPFHCTDCEQVRAVADNGYTVAAVRFCPVHRARRDTDLAAARAANPEVDAVHRMIEAARA